MSLTAPVIEKIRLQNRQTMRDLPSRFGSISIATLIAAFYLPLIPVALYYVVYVLTEVFGCIVMRRLDRRTARLWVGYLLGSATFGSSLFATLMVALWMADGAAPKIIAFSGLATSLVHCVMVRSTWMPFGLVSAVPLVSGFGLASCLHLLRTAGPLDSIAGTVLIVVMMGYILRSMLDMHSTRADLLRASERAHEASRAKSRFLAAMSHEIRTPLNAIYGIAQSLRDDADPAMVEERTALLLKASGSLKSIVDDVLDHAKIEAGRYRLSPAPANVADEVGDVVEMFQRPAAEKGLTISARTVGDVPEHLKIDALRVRQVLSNLVSNAVKFSETGRIEVALRARLVGDRFEVTIDVVDEGPGLSEEETEQLFQDFARIEREDRPVTAGTGLGLSIARGFARMMGGDITVASRPKEGATFSFSFMAAVTEPEKPQVRDVVPAETADTLSGIESILLVDDTASNRYVVQAMLRRYDLEVVEAENGREALDALAERPFSLVLLDMHMPVLDGLATFAEMKRVGGRIAQTPVIALTADASPEDRGRYLAHGLTGYLAKPMRRGDLIAEIVRTTQAQVRPAA